MSVRAFYQPILGPVQSNPFSHENGYVLLRLGPKNGAK